MARGRRNLTSIWVSKVKTPGLYPDGNGLYLKVALGKSGDINRSWIVRVYLAGGKVRDMGLGRAEQVSLAEARELADSARKSARAGTDPVATRKVERRRAAAAIQNALTFQQCADRYLEMHEPAWRNRKHRQQWRNTLRTYVFPILGDLGVDQIDTDLVVKVLKDIWLKKPPTASRVRSRIASILYWATARGYRTGENPARWKGHLDAVLPSRVRIVRHRPALSYRELPKFFGELRLRRGIAPRALEFTILTAARTGEIIGAKWSEIDLVERVWTVPAERMKASREHKVPLSPQAIRILELLRPGRKPSDYVFRGWKSGTGLSDNAMLDVLEKMGHGDVTTHGFRSTFRDYISDETDFAGELAETALAHTISNRVEAAYRRGNAFSKRVVMMSAWAEYCYSARPELDAGPIRE